MEPGYTHPCKAQTKYEAWLQRTTPVSHIIISHLCKTSYDWRENGHMTFYNLNLFMQIHAAGVQYPRKPWQRDTIPPKTMAAGYNT